MNRLADRFAAARADGRASFIGYLPAGDPDADATVGLARALERGGADVLELGVPFTDPIADGPVIQRASARALEAGTTLDDVFGMARRIRRETSLAVVLFSYLNPIHRRGVARTAHDARESGIDAVLVTDLPPDEAAPFVGGFRRAGLDTVFLASPTSPPERMRRAAALSSGFLYVVSRPGTTGARAALPRDLARTIGRARRAAGKLPIAVGFGIATPDTAAPAAALADGVVVGSALVAAAERAGGNREAAVETLARSLAAACARRGARRANA